MLRNLSREMFRAYDIRGKFTDDLTVACTIQIAKAFAKLCINAQQHTVILASDGRLSSPQLLSAFSQGLLESGIHVISLGAVPTPLLYFAAHTLSSSTAVMITGSHNPADYNGFKMLIAGNTLTSETIQQLYHLAIAEEFITGSGNYSEYDIIPDYLARVTHDITIKRPLKVVVDAGNGIAGKVAPVLLRQLGCEVVELFCEVDGLFPHHHPDPAQTKNLSDLIKLVNDTGADLGIAFDGDGDRLGMITNRGKIIWPDRQLMLFASAILPLHKGGKIIYDVKCTKHLAMLIEKAGGEPIMWKTGHSFIKAKIKETHAVLAGEMSGHLFFNDRWFGFDDALYASARLLEIVARSSESVDDIFQRFPDSVNTPELKIPLADAYKTEFMAQLLQKAHFPTASVTTLDGLRADFIDGWGLIRPSNTTPNLILRFEADNPAALNRIRHAFTELLSQLDESMFIPEV